MWLQVTSSFHFFIVAAKAGLLKYGFTAVGNADKKKKKNRITMTTEKNEEVQSRKGDGICVTAVWLWERCACVSIMLSNSMTGSNHELFSTYTFQHRLCSIAVIFSKPNNKLSGQCWIKISLSGDYALSETVQNTLVPQGTAWSSRSFSPFPK